MRLTNYFNKRVDILTTDYTELNKRILINADKFGIYLQSLNKAYHLFIPWHMIRSIDLEKVNEE